MTSIAVDPADPDRMVIAGRSIHTSTDGGRTLVATQHADMPMWIADLLLLPDGSGRIYAEAAHFYDELGVLKGGRGVLSSTDGGASWTSLTPGLDNQDVTSLAVSPDGRQLYAGTLRGSVHRILLPNSGVPGAPGGGPR